MTKKPELPFELTEPSRIIAMARGKCSYCDEHRGDGMMPPHAASANCESGKRNHCTCDVCF